MSNCWHPCGAHTHTNRADPAGCADGRVHAVDMRGMFFPAPRRSLYFAPQRLCVCVYKCMRYRMDETTKVQHALKNRLVAGASKTRERAAIASSSSSLSNHLACTLSCEGQHRVGRNYGKPETSTHNKAKAVCLLILSRLNY